MKFTHVYLSKEYLLCRAAKAGDLANTMDLLNFVDPCCLSNAALNGACFAGQQRVVQLLLDRGADPYDDGWRSGLRGEHWYGPALQWAACHDVRHDRMQLVPLLLCRKASPSHAVHRALEQINAHPKETWIKQTLGRYLVDEYAKHSPPANLLPGLSGPWVPYLIHAYKVDPNALFPCHDGQQTALARAADYLDLPSMRALLDCGADPNTVPADHGWMKDPPNAQEPEVAWAMLRLLANARGSHWTIPVDKLTELL